MRSSKRAERLLAVFGACGWIGLTVTCGGIGALRTQGRDSGAVSGSGSGGEVGQDAATGSGGSTGSGGVPGTGGGTGRGGVQGTGGSTSSGGVPGAGGSMTSGGAPGTGGSTSSGGTSATFVPPGGGGRLGSGGAAGTGGGFGSGGAGGDPNCHYDCFGEVQCLDGVVTQLLNTPVPCTYWRGACPSQVVGTCQGGCALARIADPLVCPLTICRENYPKQPGDACVAEADCHPTVAVPVDGGVSQTYLRCDAGRGICVAADAPALDDWLGRCDPKLMNQREAGSFGAVSDPTCSGGLCAFYAAWGQGCVQQGCSRLCATDEDCPQGAVCQDAASCPVSDGSPHGYCKPGARNSIGVGLLCW
jgi:hypothetical protein